jgi:hypothetical protein
MAVNTPAYRIAPPGFTREQWEQFDRDGYLVIDNVLSPGEIARYIAAIDRIAASDPKHDPTKYYGPQNAVTRDPDLVDLIDRDTHIGFAWDLYGELTKLHLSQVMIRPTRSWHNLWHPDGARALPFGVFSPRLPLQFKVGYWLTDLPRPRMGNLTVLPGSHRSQYCPHYDTHESADGEHVLCVKAGTMTLMHANTWHRVEANESDVVRKNIFLSYSPSWIVPEDRYTNDPAWLSTLTREQRIVMRSYSHPYDNTKPPDADVPLYLDRETGLDHDPDMYREHVTMNRRKRVTTIEKFIAEEATVTAAAR